MKTIEELLKNLARPEVQEFGLVTNRLPSVNVGGKYEPVDDEAPGNERLMQMLVTLGGGRHVDNLGEKPIQWTTRLEGIGVIAVAAIKRADVIQARFTVSKRDANARAPSERSLPPALPISASKLPAEPARPSIPPRLSIPPPAAVPIAIESDEVIPLIDTDGQDDKEPTLQMPSAPPAAPAPPRPDKPKSAPPAPKPPTIEDKAAQEEAVRERLIQNLAAQEQRVVQERRERERAAAEALRARSSGAMPAAGRRINTPTSVDRVEAARKASVPPRVAPTEKDLAEHAVVATKPADDGGAVSIDSVLGLAVSARATDLFVTAGRSVLLRTAGEIEGRPVVVAPEDVERMVREILPARVRETFEREGACTFALERAPHGRFRVHVAKQRTGLELCARVVPRELPTLASLGLADGALLQQSGLVLITAPAGHGKSTTLAALVEHLGREKARHVMTIENPIEFVHSGRKALVSQREVGAHARSRGRLIDTALRADVDVLVIDAIEDAESARGAFDAVDSGRLVLASVAAGSAAQAIERVVGFFDPADEAWARASIAGALGLVVGQRLVPGSDRSRQVAAVEVLPSSSELRELVRTRRTHEIGRLRVRGAAGVVRLDESLADLVRTHKVTLEVAKQFADSPDELEGQMAVRTMATPTASVKRA